MPKELTYKKFLLNGKERENVYGSGFSVHFFSSSKEKSIYL